MQITSADVTKYRVQRLDAGAAAATINRELAVSGRSGRKRARRRASRACSSMICGGAGFRNMMKSGKVDQAVAMKISGHVTDSVFRRYRIVDEDDIEQALTVTQESIAQAPARNVAEIGGRRCRRPKFV